jgi:hypothetical protein
MTRGNGFVLAILALAVGCASPQKAYDTSITKAQVGKKYSELINPSGFKVRPTFGPELASDGLAGGSKLYVHVQEYESASESTLGIWGKTEYSYRITGFKVKDDVIEDWAYGLYTPNEKAKVLFGIEYGYDHPAMLEKLKKDYPTLVKTSAGGEVTGWK